MLSRKIDAATVGTEAQARQYRQDRAKDGGAAAAAEFELKHLSFLSHDLNNNLGAIILHLKLLEQRLAGIPGFADEVSILEQAQLAIDHTTEGMRRLIAYAQLRSKRPRLNLHLVNLHQLAHRVADHYLGLAQSKGLDLAVDIAPDATIYSDADLIVLILQNLIGNAVKYSTRGTVRIHAQLLRSSYSDQWVLGVTDEGPGISSFQLKHIFSAFKRGDTHGQPGVGLGLTIASEAANLLRAALSVQSQLGVGSTFRLVLDRMPTLASQGSPAPASSCLEAGGECRA